MQSIEKGTKTMDFSRRQAERKSLIAMQITMEYRNDRFWKGLSQDKN